MNAKRIITLILIGLLIIVSIQNVETVKMNILFWSINISKLLLLILVLVIGLLTGILFAGLKKKPNEDIKIEEKQKGV
jgi:uncharacterized integral membrane protein